jgi:hypothetical protein
MVNEIPGTPCGVSKMNLPELITDRLGQEKELFPVSRIFPTSIGSFLRSVVTCWRI